MSKKQHHFAEAERLYISEQLSPEAIAGRLNICEKTVRLWKEEGGWAEKREALIKSKQMFHEELFEFARLLMRSLKEDLLKGRKVDQGRMYTFGAILNKVLKVKEYEETVKKFPELKGMKDIGKDLAQLIEEQLSPEGPSPAPESLPTEQSETNK